MAKRPLRLLIVDGYAKEGRIELQNGGELLY